MKKFRFSFFLALSFLMMTVVGFSGLLDGFGKDIIRDQTEQIKGNIKQGVREEIDKGKNKAKDKVKQEINKKTGEIKGNVKKGTKVRK